MIKLVILYDLDFIIWLVILTIFLVLEKLDKLSKPVASYFGSFIIVANKSRTI